MRDGDGACSPVIARARHLRAQRSNPVFAALWIASLALAMTGKRRRLTLPPPSFPHEVEIAAFVGLQNGLVEEMCVAAARPFRDRHGLERRAALFQLCSIDQ